MTRGAVPGDAESRSVVARILQPPRVDMSRAEILEEADACAECDPDGLRTWEGRWYIKHEYRCGVCKDRIYGLML